MTTNGIIEYILMLSGWLMNNSLWDTITSTGIWILPVSLKMVNVWMKVREEGFDEGNKGFLLLPRLENLVYVSYVVILFCCVPVLPADLHPMVDGDRAKLCRNEPAVKVNESAYAPMINQFKDGRMPSVPVWWYIVHSVSKGITQAMTSGIPCGGKIRHMRFLIQHSQLKDRVLIDELQEFSNVCYSKAYYHLKQENPKLTDEILSSVNWIGSYYFLTMPGYYDEYTAKLPKKAWPYDATRDAGYPDTGAGGYPTCKQWWQDAKIGLKDRALDNLSTMTKIQLKTGIYNHHGKNRDPDEVALRWLVSPDNIELSAGGAKKFGSQDKSQGSAGNLWRVLANIGAGAEQLSALPKADAMRRSAPVMLNIAEMMFIVAVPLILVFSGYSIKVVVSLTAIFFGLLFIPFWWEMADWLDQNLTSMLYDDYSNHYDGPTLPMDPLRISMEVLDKAVGRASDGWIINLVFTTMYGVVPGLWLTMLGWTGLQVGSLANSISQGSASAANAGAKGAGLVKDTVTFGGKVAMAAATGGKSAAISAIIGGGSGGKSKKPSQNSANYPLDSF